MTDLLSYDKETWLDTVWIALHTLHKNQITEESWDDVCTAMSWIEKELGYTLNKDGDYVRIEQ